MDPFRSEDEAIESAGEFPNPPIAEPIHGEDNPFRKIAHSPTTRVRQVWSVGGGKGGVGKSLVSANIAISLARAGHKVIAIDLDLGSANLHTSLGIGLPKKSLSDFLDGEVPRLNDCATPSQIANLDVISGAQDSINVADLSFERKLDLFQQIRELNADYVLLDLGAGTTADTIDFFLCADVGILIALPEPTSIENLYRFIKTSYFRRLGFCSKLQPIRNMIDEAKNPSELYKDVTAQHPAVVEALKDEIAAMRIKLILNQARTQTDVDIGFSIKSVCKKYFGIDLDYIGYLDYDSAVWQAVRRKKPLMVEFPNSQLVANIEKVTNYVIRRYADAKNTLIGR